jgi:hypothetical protein
VGEPLPHNTRKQSSRRRLVQDPVADKDKDKRARVPGTDVGFVCLACKRLKVSGPLGGGFHAVGV